MAYPNFVCMGFQKCGTTTLHGILSQHPGIALCRDVKEPMYYRVPLASYLGLGSRYYNRRYFGHLSCEDTRITGEINAGLTFVGCVKKLRHGFSPDTRLIFMLRNPIDRSFSAYKYFLARGLVPGKYVAYDKAHGHGAGFDRYIRDVLEQPRRRRAVLRQHMRYLVLSQSNYAACIRPYLDTFPLQHYILFEEFVKDQQRICEELYRFLGIPDCPETDYHLRLNEGAEQTVSGLRAWHYMLAKGFHYFLYDLIAMPHWAPGVYGLYRRYYDGLRKRAFIPDTDTSRPLPETRRYLAEYFLPDVLELEQLTGRDLRKIWNLEVEKL